MEQAAVVPAAVVPAVEGVEVEPAVEGVEVEPVEGAALELRAVPLL